MLRLDLAFSSFAGDVILHYLYGKDHGLLQRDGFHNSIIEGMEELTGAVHWLRFFPLLGSIFRLLPPSLGRILQPGTRGIYDLQDSITQQVTRKDGSGQKTIFDALTDPSIPPEERTLPRLQDEGLIIMSAGTDTTASVLTVASLHLLHNKALLAKLRAELQSVMPTPTSTVPFAVLEKLPYFVSGLFPRRLKIS